MKEIEELIKNKEIILFGEIHGTKEIPIFLMDFLKKLFNKEKFDLCLEIPIEYQENPELFFIEENKSGGLTSMEYFNLIKELKKIGIKIFFINDFANNQEQKEKNLYKNILKVKNNQKIIAILGEVHASKKPIFFNNLKIFPAGHYIFKYFGERMASIRIISKKGEFFNNGIKKIIYNSDDPFNNNFDFVYELKKISPCTFMDEGK